MFFRYDPSQNISFSSAALQNTVVAQLDCARLQEKGQSSLEQSLAAIGKVPLP